MKPLRAAAAHARRAFRRGRRGARRWRKVVRRRLRPVTRRAAALREAFELTLRLANGRAVVLAHRAGQPLPPLALRGGLVIHHDGSPETLKTFREIFHDRSYTGGRFYEPGPRDLVLDCGANVGLFALYLVSRAPGIRVHCFEPAAGNRALLLRNVDENALGRHVHVHAFALADARGERRLLATPEGTQRSLFPNEFTLPGEGEPVPCLGLDDAIALADGSTIDYLKIDCEGAEVEILEGASAAALARVRRVGVECHDRWRPRARERVLGVLARSGFRIVDERRILDGVVVVRASRCRAGTRGA